MPSNIIMFFGSVRVNFFLAFQEKVGYVIVSPWSDCCELTAPLVIGGGFTTGKLTHPWVCTHPLLKKTTYTPGSSNIAIAGKWGPRIESMYFLLKIGIFHGYVSLPDGISAVSKRCFLKIPFFFPQKRLVQIGTRFFFQRTSSAWNLLAGWL